MVQLNIINIIPYKTNKKKVEAFCETKKTLTKCTPKRYVFMKTIIKLSFTKISNEVKYNIRNLKAHYLMFNTMRGNLNNDNKNTFKNCHKYNFLLGQIRLTSVKKKKKKT